MRAAGFIPEQRVKHRDETTERDAERGWMPKMIAMEIDKRMALVKCTVRGMDCRRIAPHDVITARTATAHMARGEGMG